MNIPEFNVIKLVELLLNQQWHKECEIITNWMPKFPNKDTIPKVVVKYPNEFEDVYLRYSCGPQQGFFWDTYPDDLMNVELAILALHQAPLPLNYKKLQTHVEFTFPKKNLS